MKIIKTLYENIIIGRRRKKQTNHRHDICPHCGGRDLLFTGEAWGNGFFTLRVMVTDFYICKNCGEKWEGDTHDLGRLGR